MTVLVARFHHLNLQFTDLIRAILNRFIFSTKNAILPGKFCSRGLSHRQFRFSSNRGARFPGELSMQMVSHKLTRLSEDTLLGMETDRAARRFWNGITWPMIRELSRLMDLCLV